MRETRQIIRRWRTGSASVLATLVRLQGSSYRQPGARLLLCNDGTSEGSLSAGCLEADLLKKASWLVRNGSTVERYSTLSDETGDMPFGLGCGGIIDILLEPVQTPECQALMQALESSLSCNERLIATWLPVADRRMRRAVFTTDGDLVFASDSLPSDLITQARMIGLSSLSTLPCGIFMERLLRPQRLFVFGAGDDAKALVTMAALLGWDVTVLDGRSHLAQKGRFPEAKVQVTSNVDSRSFLSIDSRDAVVVMTHSYEQDKDSLTSLLPLRPRFLGLLGSKKRSWLLITEVAGKLDWSVSECCEVISAPIGLDIGGEGPEAIALAILAEIQACCAGKRVESRRLSAPTVLDHVMNRESLRSLAQCGLDRV